MHAAKRTSTKFGFLMNNMLSLGAWSGLSLVIPGTLCAQAFPPQPVYSQPGPAQQNFTQQNFAQPNYAQPNYAQPGLVQPGMNQPYPAMQLQPRGLFRGSSGANRLATPYSNPAFGPAPGGAQGLPPSQSGQPQPAGPQFIQGGQGGQFGTDPRIMNAGGNQLNPKFITISQNVGNDPAIFQQIEQVASRYPLCVIVGEGVASQIIYSETIEDGPFEEEIMGARVRGQQRTVARTAIDFLPSDTSVKMNFVLSGSSQSSTLSTVRQAAVQSSSTVDFDITKEVDFDGMVFSTRSPAAFMKINQQNLGASTAVSPIPLLGPLARDIVMNAAEQRRPYTETIAAHRITQLVAPTFNRQVDEALLTLNQRLSQQLRPLLQQAQLEPSHLSTSSTPEAGIWGIAFEKGLDSTAGLGLVHSVGLRGERSRRLPVRRLTVTQPGLTGLMQQQPQSQNLPIMHPGLAQPIQSEFQPVQPLNPQANPQANPQPGSNLGNPSPITNFPSSESTIPTLPGTPGQNVTPETTLQKPEMSVPALGSQKSIEFSPEMANINNRVFILVHESLIEDIATRYELAGRDVDPELFRTFLASPEQSSGTEAPIGVLKLAEDEPVTATITKEEFQIRVLAGFQPTVGPEIPTQETLFTFTPVLTDDTVILRPVLKSIKPLQESNGFTSSLLKIAGETVVRTAIEQRLKEYVLPRSLQIPREGNKPPLNLRLQSLTMSEGWMACVYEPAPGVGTASLPLLESVMKTTLPTSQDQGHGSVTQ